MTDRKPREPYALRVVDGPDKGMVFHQTFHRSDLDRALQFGTDADRYELVRYDGHEWVRVE